MDTSKLKSRKLWVAVIGAALVVLLKQLGVDDGGGTAEADAAQTNDLVGNVVTLLVAYILGESGVDIAAMFKKPKSSDPTHTP